VNALAPAALAEAARSAGKHLIHVSTDFVFDGTGGPYDEEEDRSPYSDRLSWYGWTKSEGERRVRLADPTAAIVRIAYPYRSNFSPKADFAHRILRRYRGGTLPPQYVDQQISPTWVPDVSAAIAELLRERHSGIVHVASPVVTSPFEFATTLIERVEARPVDLARGSLAGAPPDPRRAPRPRLGGLKPVRAIALGISLTPWREGIEALVRAEGGSP
jgi:dTDP-4-dehydrorhamnose reductase